ncbi:KxYKxGKxW signal peptide domain-containing protein [Lacticaseibacillus jixianensis]|uniref:KxYKxGKxW signal peptide domain-containing protein n=1 Tax=Lacticaseibacillus jixianensis TaxID=2486012 RepID=A0ABW4B922_9LACO|nr:KxYKxGKxW signal peptide domain-containing protein [Lacticaseibacillus jixianensis]
MANRHLFQELSSAMTDEKRHYKMYKSGKTWLLAGISLIFAGALSLQQPIITHADTSDNASVTAESNLSLHSSTSTTALGAVKKTTTDSNDSDVSRIAAQTKAQTSSSADSQKANQANSNLKGNSTNASSTPSTNSRGSSVTRTLVDATSTVQGSQDQLPSTSSATVTGVPAKVGVGSGVTKDVHIVFHMTAAKAGDSFSITIPDENANSSWGFDGSKAEPVPLADGTTTRTHDEAHHTWTITNKLVTTKTIQQDLTLYIYGNDRPTPKSPIDDIGVTNSQITYAVNGQEQAPITITQTVDPAIKINPITRVNPTGVIKRLLPTTTYVYQFTTPEENGVQNQTSSASSRINSAVNYGTTITIPVPTGFTLDEELTKKLNQFSDETTITQDGSSKDIIITVPKGSGNNSWSQVYQIAGKYDVPPTDNPHNLTAPGRISLVQKLGDGPDARTLTYDADPWTAIMEAAGDGDNTSLPVKSQPFVNGNYSNPYDDRSKITLASTGEKGKPIKYLNSFTFTYEGAADQADSTATFTISVPDGLDATGFQVPTEQIRTDSDPTKSEYLPGTTSYSAKVTFVGGSSDSKTIEAGGRYDAPDGQYISSIELTPNYLAPGAISQSADDGKDGMYLFGKVAERHHDLSPVKVGDRLTTRMSMKVVGTEIDKTYNGEFTQTVVAPAPAEAPAIGYSSGLDFDGHYHTWPGTAPAGEISMYGGGNWGQTADLIKDPILYVVLPKTVHLATDEEHQPRIQGAKFKTESLPDGRTLVTFDYTGTSVDTSKPTMTYSTLFWDNQPDAMPTTEPIEMLIYSPTTTIMKSENIKAITDPILLAKVHQGTVQYFSTDWKIEVASTQGTAALAQGNLDSSPAAQGKSDIHRGSTSDWPANKMNFAIDMQNNTDIDATNAYEVINLPYAGDAQGSTLNFTMTGPVTLPSKFSNGDSLTTRAVLYSDKPAVLTTGSTTFDRSGYVDAAGVAAKGGWSTIKSVLVDIGTIPSHANTADPDTNERITIPGLDESLLTDSGKTGYLQTGFYINDNPVQILGGKDEKTSATSIAVQGTDTVTARLHYKDQQGTDQYIELPDLTKVYKDGSDEMKETDFPQVSDPAQTPALSESDKALIPAGYHLAPGNPVVKNLGNGGNAYDENHLNKPAKFGEIAQYYFDGDVVQYELVSDNPVVTPPKATTVTTSYTVNYAGLPDTLTPVPVTRAVEWTATTDEKTNKTIYVPNTGSVESVTSPSIPGYAPDIEATNPITLTSMTTAPTSLVTTVTYHPVDAALTVTYVDDTTGEKVTSDLVNGVTGKTGEYSVKVPTGYVLAKNQADRLRYTLTTDDTDNLIVHLTHETTQGESTTTRTITYVVYGSMPAPEKVTQTVKWQIVTDKVTGESVATPENGYTEVASPSLEGYKPDQAKVPQEGLAAKVIKSTDELKDENVTVTYTPVPVAQELQVTYVDDAQEKAIVGTPTFITGQTGDKGTYEVKVPENYELAKGQPSKIPYQLTDGAKGIVIHLSHILSQTEKSTTRTITYVVYGSMPAPTTVKQTVKWTITTDKATGATLAVPQNVYTEVASPRLVGYTPDQAVVPQEGLGAKVIKTADDLKDENVIVTYTPAPVADELQVTYVERGAQGTPDKLLETEMITGKIGDNGDYIVHVPADLTGEYESLELAPGTKIPYRLTSSADGIVIYLHRVVGTTPGNPGTPTNGGGTTPGNPGTPTNGGGTTPGNPGTPTNGGGTTPGNPGTPTNGGGTTPGNPGTPTDGGSTTPGNPGTPTDGDETTPGNPITPTGDDGSDTGTPESAIGGDTDLVGKPETGTTVDGGQATGTVTEPTQPESSLQQTADKTPTKTPTTVPAKALTKTSARRTLPETGNAVGTGLAVLGISLLSLLGLAERKRKIEH